MIQTIKQNKKAVLAFLLALVMLIGIIPFTATEVQALNTISTGDTFEHGDQINVYCVGSNKSVIYTASVSEGVTTWTSDEKLFFAPGNTTITACYPLRTHLSRVSLPLDQSTEAKVKSADHMTALSSDTLPSEPVDLHFKHLMAKITVKYKLDTEFDVGTSIAKAEIYSRHTEFHTFSPAGGGFRKSRTPDWITSWINGNEFTAIVSPDVYSAGDDFIRVTIGNEVLSAKMPEDKQLEEGKHYTFDLTVGKNAVKITSVNVSGDWSHNEGWNDEVILNGSDVGTKDIGKKAWESGDRVIATLVSSKYGSQSAALTYNGSKWVLPEGTVFKYLPEETPTVTAVYAPSDPLGTGEYLEVEGVIANNEITFDLSSAQQNYSRLRIAGEKNTVYTVKASKFTPAGSTVTAPATYSVTSDENGNAYIYGIFAAGSTVTVSKDGITHGKGTFYSVDYPNGTEQGKSYLLELEGYFFDEDTRVYQVYNAKGLYKVAEIVNGGRYDIKISLVSDIILNQSVLKADGTLNGDGSNFTAWTPIGGQSSTPREDSFIGTFDGNGHTVSGLYVNSSSPYQGLFGYVGASGTVKNVGITDSYVKGEANVGSVAGAVAGTISNCFNEGTVVGESITGGLVGFTENLINNCYNTGHIIADDYVGGVVGHSYVSVQSCYNTGKISTTGSNVGSVGYISYQQKVKNCYCLSDSALEEENGTLGKTSAQFASSDMADLLNTNQYDSPWEYIAGNPAPTLKVFNN